MRNKLTTYLQLLIFVYSLVFSGGMGFASNEETSADMGPAEIILKTKSARKQARFPHKKHQKIFKCRECHHSRSDNGIKLPYVKGMKIRKCISCHNKNDMSNPRLNTFKLIAHGLCKECHKKNKDSAPTKCSGCHIK